MVAFGDVANVPTNVGDYSRAFVAETQWTMHVRPIHVVELGVADPAGEQFDDYLVRARVWDFDLVDDGPLV
jgi:hypothetical protein